MPVQNDHIGEHPIAPSIFNKWFSSVDKAITATCSHRQLDHLVSADDVEIIDWLSQKIVDHHYSEKDLATLKKKYAEAGFAAYAKEMRRIPNDDNTRKGNATEIILLEYLKESLVGLDFVYVKRFRYSTNVDQAMKGDDVLMLHRFTDNQGNDQLLVLLGEAKFRSIPSNAVLDELKGAVAKDKLPVSFSFLVKILRDNPATEAIADELDNFVMDKIKAAGHLRYVGLLLSNHNAGRFIQTNFSSDNPDLVILSATSDAPSELIAEAFKKAEYLLANP